MRTSDTDLVLAFEMQRNSMGYIIDRTGNAYFNHIFLANSELSASISEILNLPDVLGQLGRVSSGFHLILSYCGNLLAC